MNFSGYGDRAAEPGTGSPPVLSVLCVDDEPFLLEVCKLYLERRPDISVSVASSVESAVLLFASGSFDVIVSDYQMPVTDGIAFLRIVREKNNAIPFIFFTCHGEEEIITKAPAGEALFYLRKSGNPPSLFSELEKKIRDVARRDCTGRSVHGNDPFGSSIPSGATNLLS